MTSLSGRRVLIVEDEYFLGEEIKAAVEEAGGTPLGPYARQAEALPELGHVDIAVLNMRVRDGDIYPLAAILRERAIPFVFATAQGASSIPEEWRRAARVEKPYELDRLMRLLADHLAKAG